MPGVQPPPFPEYGFVVREAPVEAILAAAADLRQQQQQEQLQHQRHQQHQQDHQQEHQLGHEHAQFSPFHVPKQRKRSLRQAREERHFERIMPHEREGVIIPIEDFSISHHHNQEVKSKRNNSSNKERTIPTAAHNVGSPNKAKVSQRVLNAQNVKRRVVAPFQYEASSDSADSGDEADDNVSVVTATEVAAAAGGLKIVSFDVVTDGSDTDPSVSHSMNTVQSDDDNIESESNAESDSDDVEDSAAAYARARRRARFGREAATDILDDREVTDGESVHTDMDILVASSRDHVSWSGRHRGEAVERTGRHRRRRIVSPSLSFGDDIAEFAGITDGEQQDGRLLYAGAGFGASSDVRGASGDVAAVVPLADAFLSLAESEAEATRRVDKEATMAAWPLSGEDTEDNALNTDSDFEHDIADQASDHCLVMRLPRSPNAITSSLAASIGKSDHEPGSLVCVHLMSLEDVTAQEELAVGANNELLPGELALSDAVDDFRDPQPQQLQEHLLATSNDRPRKHLHKQRRAGNRPDEQLVVVTPILTVKGTENNDSQHDKFVEVGAMPLSSVQAAITELRRRGTRNVRVLATLMLGLWIAFNLVQGLLVSAFPELGTAILATYYLGNVLASFKVGAVLERFAPLSVLRATWIPYVFFIGLLALYAFFPEVSVFAIFCVAMTAIVGIAAASMWTAQSMYLGFNSDATTIAKNNGIFHGIYMNNFILSNLSAALLLSFKAASVPQLFSAAAVLACCAAIGAFFMKPPSFVVPKGRTTKELQQEFVVVQVSTPVAEDFLDDHPADSSLQDAATAYLLSSDEWSSQSDTISTVHDEEAGSTRPFPPHMDKSVSANGIGTPSSSLVVSSGSAQQLEIPSFLASVRRDAVLLFSLHKRRSVRMIFVMWLYTGLFYSFLFGPLPLLLRTHLVGFGLAAFGVMTVLSATCFAWLVGTKNFIHPRTAVFVGAAVQCITLVLAVSAWLSAEDSMTRTVLTFGAYAMEGIADGALNPNLLALVPASAPMNVAGAYNLFRVHQNLATACTYVLMKFAGFEVLELSILQGAVLVLACGLLWKHGPIIVTT